MASLANQTISSTYDGLIKTSTDQPVPATGVQLLEDGLGNSLSVSIGRVNNGIEVSGTVTATAFVGDGSGLTGISVSPTLDEVTTNGATTTNSITVGNVTATSFVKSGGTSAQFLKADGTVDSNTYLTSFTETNDLTAAVVWANVPDANITQSSVTQHQAALSITESQISDLQSYLTAESDTLDSVTDRGATTTNSITVGGISITGTLLDSNGQAGTSGQILSSTATGIDWVDAAAGGGDVTSVNGQTGVVVLDADDIDDTSTTNKFTTAGDISKLAGIEALADVTDATNVAAAGALMSGTAALSDLVDVSSATPSDGQVLTYDTVNGWQPETVSGGGGGTDYTVQTISTNTTAVKDNFYVLTASLTLTLPASPSVGDKVAVSNMSGTLTPVVARNGELIGGLAEDLTIDADSVSVEFIYSGATKGWVLFVDGIAGADAGGGGTAYTIQEISTNTTAVKDNLYVLTASLTLTLPASPAVGDKVALSNMSDTITPVVARNGNLILGLAEDLTINVKNLSVEFIYSGATEGWIVFTDTVLGYASTSTVDGSGTTNYISKWSDADTLTDSVIYDDGTNVGIGTNNPASKLEIFGYGNGLSFRGAASDYSSLNLFIEDGVAAKIQSTEVGAGTVLPVAVLMKGVETARFQPTGGISFNGDTAAANALDDYEEGTWTMGISFDGNSVGVSYNINTGSYTKIGNKVTVTGFLVLLSKGTSTGAARITGLPYTISNTDTDFSAPSFRLDSVSFADFVQAYGLRGSSVIVLEETTNAGLTSGLDNTNFTNSSRIIISFTYFTS